MISLYFGFSPDIFSLVRHKIFRRNLRYFRPLKSHYWSNGRNISEISPIFFYVFRRGKIFRRYLRYTGASSNIRLLQDVKNIGEVCRTLAFRGKLRNFRHFPQKKKYRILKNQKVRGCFKRHLFEHLVPLVLSLPSL